MDDHPHQDGRRRRRRRRRSSGEKGGGVAMLESQPTTYEVNEVNEENSYEFRQHEDDADSCNTSDAAAAMDYHQAAGGGGGARGRGGRLSAGCVDLGRELFVQTWRNRPRDCGSVATLLRRNVVALILVLSSGILTWESSVDELRTRVDRTIAFPLYLPHSVALAVACVWTTAVAPGNFLGLYLVRLYMIGRLPNVGFTSLNTTIMLLVAFLATLQSHIGAFFLRKYLCSSGSGRRVIPTIESVAEAVWYLVTVSVLSLVFGMLTALCIGLTPLIQWSSFWRYWATWWLGVLAAMITVTPLLTHLLAWEWQASSRTPVKIAECVLVALTTSGVMVVVFFLNFEHFRPLPYLCFPLITWTAFRFNRVGWAITVSVVAYCCALGSIRKRGAFYGLSPELPVSSARLILQIELFSCVMGVVGITLAAAIREKQHLTQRLHQLNVELEETVDLRTLKLRKANEELQVSQKKAEQASHAKSDFLANMSHEIRTPIHGILGLTALLLESELTPDQEESLVSVKECADLLLHIINSVLDLAKIEAGRLEVEKVPFNIRKMVSSTFRMLQARAQQRGLQLLWEVDKSVPQTLVGDIGKLQQCLMNLVGNALKFTHKGSVTVDVRVVAEVTTTALHNVHDECGSRGVGSSGSNHMENSVHPPVQDNMVLEFEVRDTGIGISQEKLQDMFKPFTQADTSTSRLYGGTGLGLCIVERFVELLGGTIWAESELGKGSAFYFRLPFLLNSPKESPSEISPKTSAPKNLLDKFNSRGQPWSLMGGLMFNPPGKYQQQPEPDSQTRASNLASRGRSTNDLLGLWKESREALIDDQPSAALLVRQGSERLSERLRGGTVEKTLSNPEQQLLDSCLHSDGSASNEVTTPTTTTTNRSKSFNPTSSHKHKNKNNYKYSNSVEKLVSSSSSSDWGAGAGAGGGSAAASFLLKNPHEGPMDSATLLTGEAVLSGAGVEERERGDVSSGLLVRGGDLSRESSAELEHMLVSEVSLNILLAEDNAINQKVASRQLEKHGHVVTIVGDGQEALDVMCFRHDDFDLVLMDVQMPIMDGLRATELIRKAESEKGWSRVPILGLTAHAIQGYQDTCLQHGMDGYLGKPFDIHQLLKTIGHMLPPDTLSHHALHQR